MKVPLRRVVMTSPAQNGPGIPGNPSLFIADSHGLLIVRGLNDFQSFYSVYVGTYQYISSTLSTLDGKAGKALLLGRLRKKLPHPAIPEVKKLAGEMAEQNHLMMPGCPSPVATWVVVFPSKSWDLEGFEG